MFKRNIKTVTSVQTSKPRKIQAKTRRYKPIISGAHPSYAFNEEWFDKQQYWLLFLLNNKYTKRWFRWVMRINKKQDCPLDLYISRITPYSYVRFHKWVNDKEVELSADCRTSNKYARRIYYAFRPVWWALHLWDLIVADKFLPEYSFGFSTLTQYPSSTSAGNPIDGSPGAVGGGYSWSQIRSAAGNDASQTGASVTPIFLHYLGSDYSNSIFYWAFRGIFCYNTSALGSGSTISSATVGFCPDSAPVDNMVYGVQSDLDTWLVTSTPASTSSLASGDYAQISTTKCTASSITFTTWAANSYSSFTLNATGLSNISKTGISKFGTKSDGDISNLTPIYTNDNSDTFVSVYSSANTGTTKDPKIVVTYTAPAVTAGGAFLYNLI